MVGGKHKPDDQTVISSAGILQLLTSVLVDVQIVDYFHSVAPELSVENPICDLDGGQDGHDVEGFPEGIFQVIQVVFLVVSDEISSNICISDNLEPFPPSTSFVFLFPAPVPVSIAILFVVVSIFLPILVAIPTSVVLGTDEHLRPRLLSSDDVTEQIGLEEFLPENVWQFGDD